MCNIPDNLDLFLSHQAIQEREEARLPRCEKCECVLDDYCYDIGGKFLCKDCFDDAFHVDIYSDDIICDCCEKPIEDDSGYFIDGVYLCAEHTEGAYRISTPENDY